MPEQSMFEYAVIRIVPRVEREEFLNVGVVLYCSKQKFLQIKFELDGQRLTTLSAALDLAELQKHLDTFDRICHADPLGGPISKLPIAERFRWLTAARSTVVQTSRVHPGLCDDAGEMLERLYRNLVV